MSCSFAALAACFSLSGLYLDAGTEVLAHQHRQYTDAQGELNVYVLSTPPVWERNFVRTYDSYDRRVANPYGLLSLGYEIDVGKLRIDASAFYQNSFSVADRGDKGAQLHLRFFPFR